jgi:hypothetical protein
MPKKSDEIDAIARQKKTRAEARANFGLKSLVGDFGNP